MSEHDPVNNLSECDGQLEKLEGADGLRSTRPSNPTPLKNEIAPAEERVDTIQRRPVSPRVVEAIGLLGQSLASSQFSEAVALLNRPVVSPKAFEPIGLLGQSLASSQFSEAVALLNRPVVSPKAFEPIGLLGQSLASSQFSEAVALLSRPLVSPQVSETMKLASQSGVATDLGNAISALNRSIPASWVAEVSTAKRSRMVPAAVRPTELAAKIQAAGLTDIEDEHIGSRTLQEIWSTQRDRSREDSTIADGTRFLQLKFDLLVTDGGLRRACRNLFMDGHYAESVRKAYTYIDNKIRDKSGLVEKYGADLMRTVLSAKNPVLRLNDLATLSDKNEQQGYMEMLAGAMIGIRNPRSHENDFVDRPEEALELLVMANHFMRVLNKATPT